MISKIVDADLITREPSILDYLRTGSTSYASQIAEAYEVLILDLKNRGLKIRLLTTPFPVTTDKSIEDTVERLKVVCSVSGLVTTIEDEEEVTETATVILQGTNEESSETYETIATFAFTANGEQSANFTNPKKFYKYTLTTDSTTAAVDCYLVETSFEQAHICLSLAMIFEGLARTGGDVYLVKAESYRQSYNDMLDRLKYTYDYSDSGNVEAQALQSKVVRLTRGRNYVGY